MSTPAATRSASFQGFPEGGIDFFLQLQAEQTRTWFKAHEGDFQRLWRRPLEQLVADLQSRLVDVYPGVAEVTPHFFRIQRDTRFARDKSPYKTYVAADLPIRPLREGEEAHGVPGMYLSFGLEGEYVAMGAWHMSPEVLERYRVAVADEQTGPPLQRIVDGLVGDGFKIEAMEALKRVPPPYAKDHVRGELLKNKGLAVSKLVAEDLSGSPELTEWIAKQMRAVAPLAAWFDRHFKLAGSGERAAPRRRSLLRSFLAAHSLPRRPPCVRAEPPVRAVAGRQRASAHRALANRRW